MITLHSVRSKKGSFKKKQTQGTLKKSKRNINKVIRKQKWQNNGNEQINS